MQARKMTVVQGSGNLLAVEPWRAELLKRSMSTGSDGDPGVLQNFNAGVKNGPFRGAEIWRGRNPLDDGALKEIVAMPVFHGDDVKVGADVIFGVEKLGELANREAVTHRQRK